jgi:adiponectin receptor
MYNEFMNIYSHLLGVVLFVVLLIYIYVKLRYSYTIVKVGDIVGFILFFFGATLCFFLSACFYIILNHSEKVVARKN